MVGKIEDLAHFEAPDEELAAPAAPARAYYALGILVLVFTLNFIDRTVANVLIDPIKKELQLSDTVMGVIVGFGFTILYALLGVPVGRWADAGNRRNVISLGLLVWSAFTALSGMAYNTFTLAATRIGVGVGESCGWAPAVSMISDYFPRAQRAKAVGILTSASTIGSALGLAIGGYVGQHYGWRAAFYFAGIPGLITVALLRFTVIEPTHGGSESRGANSMAYPVGEVVRFVLSQRSAVLTILGGIALGLYAYTYSTWTPSLLRRVHHMSGDQIAAWVTPIHLIFGISGGLFGGWITDVAGRRDARWLAWSPALMFVLACPAALLLVLPESTTLSLVGIGCQTLLGAALYGPCWAIIQNVVRVRMRAVTLSIALGLNTMVGFGLGAPLIGYLNDSFAPVYHDMAIRYSLIVPAVITLLGGLIFAIAAPFVPGDIKRALDSE